MEPGSKGPPLRLDHLPAYLEDKLEHEQQVLDLLVVAQARGQATQELWDKLHAAAMRDDRTTELCFAYERLKEDRRVRIMPPQHQAEIFMQASRFLLRDMGDIEGAQSALERVLTLVPGNADAFDRLRRILEEKGDRDALANLHISAVGPKTDRDTALLHLRAALEHLPPEDAERATKVAQQILRLDPSDQGALDAIEGKLAAAGKYPELAKLLEQALLADPGPSEARRLDIRRKLLELYDDKVPEIERSVPHIEEVLASDPANPVARRVAGRLLSHRALGSRVAAALERVYEAEGDLVSVAQMLNAQIEQLRGPKKAEAQRKLGIIQYDGGEDVAAFQNFEAVLTVDPADDGARDRYVVLAGTLGRQADATKVLTRAAGAVKDPAVRARINLAAGRFMADLGDPKRARVILQGVLDQGEDDVALDAARSLRDMVEHSGEMKALAAVLEAIAKLSPEPDERLGVLRRLAQIYEGELKDLALAIQAQKRVLELDPTTDPAELERLLEARGDFATLAEVIEIRAGRMPVDDARRELLLQVASLRSQKANDVGGAGRVLLRIVEEHGPSRDVHALLLPILESSSSHEALSRVLAAELELASGDERPDLLGRLGAALLAQSRHIEALAAFAELLDRNPGESTARASVLELLDGGAPEVRLAASEILVSLHREEGDLTALVHALDVRAELHEDPAVRLESLAEAHEHVEQIGKDRIRALFLAGRGLRQAVLHDLEGLPAWLDRISDSGAKGPSKAVVAETLASALRDQPTISHPALARLAQRTGEAYAASGDVQKAINALRRVLELEPDNEEVLERIDMLLAEKGSPDERIALYRTSLERPGSPNRRRELWLSIGRVQTEGQKDLGAAIETYRAGLAELEDDHALRVALLDTLEAAGRLDELIAELERDRLRLAEGSKEAAFCSLKLGGVAVAKGDPVSAVPHFQSALGCADLELDGAQLDPIERVGNEQSAVPLLVAVARRRVDLAEPGAGAATANEHLGGLLADRAGEPAEAAVRFAEAAEQACEIGDLDRAVRDFERSAACAPGERGALQRLAEIHAGRGAGDALLSVTERLLVGAADRAEAIGLVEGIIDLAADGRIDEVERVAAKVGERYGLGLDLARVRAEALARAGRAVEAADALRELLDKGTGDDATEAAVVLEAFLEQRDGDPALLPQRRALFVFRIQRADAAGDATLARDLNLGSARFELEAAKEPERAKVMLDALLKAEPTDADALAMRLQIALQEGDHETAVRCLEARLEALSGDAERVQARLDLGELLLGKLGRPGDALVAVEPLIDVAPTEPRLRAVALAALAQEEFALRAAAVLERVAEAEGDLADRAAVYEALLTGPAVRALGDAKRRYYEAWLACLEGDAGRSLEVAARAAREVPDEEGFWDRAEELAREAERPQVIADAYRAILAEAQSLPEEVVQRLGERGVAFQEEFFDDQEAVTVMLRLVVEAAPMAAWAVERLKLVYNMGERWEELFALYDHVIAAQTNDQDRALILEDAVEVARDLTADADRAMGYLERLRQIRPKDQKLEAQLERLYERHGRAPSLIELLTARVPRLTGEDARETRLKIAQLWSDPVGDRGPALEILRPLIEADDVDAIALSSGWLTTLPTPEGPQSLASPARTFAPWRRLIEQLGDVAAAALRARIATALEPHFLRSGLLDKAAHMIEIGLEPALERAARRAELARLLVVRRDELDDADAALQVALADLALTAAGDEEEAAISVVRGIAGEDRDRLTREVEALCALGEVDPDGDRALRLLRLASEVAREELKDESRAIGVDLAILSRSDQDPEAAREAARQLDRTLLAAGREPERCQVLERLALLEPTPAERRAALVEAARLAEEVLDDRARAIRSLRAWLTETPDDVEVISTLIKNLRKTGDSAALVEALEARSTHTKDPAEAQTDRIEISRLLSVAVSDLEASVKAYRRVIDLYGADDVIVDELAMVLERAKRDDELAELLQKETVRAAAPERKCESFARLGDVERRRGRVAASLDAFIAALEILPSSEPAQDGLGMLLGGLLPDGSDRPDFVRGTRALAKSFEKTKAFGRWLEVVPSLAAAYDTDEERCDLLLRAADVEESPAGPDAGGTPLGALERTVQAFVLLPGHPGVAAAMLTRATATGRWDLVAPKLLPALAVRADVADGTARDLLVRAADWSLSGGAAALDELPHGSTGLVEALLTAAYARAPKDDEVLSKLVDARREVSGAPFVDALKALSDLRAGDVAALREATTVAARELGKPEIALALGEELLKLSTARLASASDDEDLRDTVLWSLDVVTTLLGDADRPDDVKARLLDAASLPVSASTTAGFLRRAADLAAPEEAATILERLYARDATAFDVAERLIALYEQLARPEDLARIYRRMAEVSPDVEERARLRLVLAELLVGLGRPDEAIETLRFTIGELERHTETVERLARLLETQGKHADLLALLESQADLAFAQDVPSAKILYERACRVADESLGDTRRAARAFKKVVEIDDSEPNLDRLATLFERAKLFEDEAAMLERVAAARGVADADLALRQATAYARSGQNDRAREGLERAVDQGQATPKVRSVLADVYRSTSAWEPLAKLSLVEADLEADLQKKLEHFRDAAALWTNELERPEGAIPILERAVELKPDELGTLAALAEALGKAGRHAEAKSALERVLAEFGTRRPKERALFHFELGKLALAQSDRSGALAEFEKASKIDPTHGGVLMMLAEIALEEGQLLRAQRTFRALLMVLRSPLSDKEKAREVPVSKARVLVELAYVSEKQNEPDRREEYIESAFEAARHNSDEWKKLVAALEKRGFQELVVRALEQRLEAEDIPEIDRAGLELDLATLMSTKLSRGPEAVEVALRAFARAPLAQNIYDRVLVVLEKEKATPRLLGAVQSLAEAATDPGERADLLLRTARLAETAIGDDAVAADVYEAALAALDEAGRAEPVRRAQILTALDPITERLAGLGKSPPSRHAGVLASLVELATAEGAGFEAVAAPLYRLVSVQLRAQDTSAATEMLARAVREDPDGDRVERELRAGLEVAKTDVALARLFEDFAREKGRARAIVDALEMLADREGGDPVQQLRAAYDASLDVADDALSERLLRRIVPASKDSDNGDVAWALVALGDRRAAAGDSREAVELWERASRVSDPGDERMLLMKVAQTARTPLADLKLAARVLDELREREPADREIWSPLADVYRELGDSAALATLIDETIPLVDDLKERAGLRFILAQMFETSDPSRAAEVLSEASEEDPSNQAACALLMKLFEATGQTEKLLALLERLLDSAKDTEDKARVLDYSMRIGALREAAGDDDAALETYHATMDWDDKHVGALRAAVRLMMKRDDSMALGDMLDRLLAIETGEEATELALKVADLKDASGDKEASEAALLAGFRANPKSAVLRLRLATIYEARGDVIGRARLSALEAQTLTDAAARKDLVVKAADTIKAEGDQSEALELYARALSDDPNDRDVLFSFMEVCANVSQHHRGVEAIDRILSGGAEPEDAPWLYFSRAVLREAIGQNDAALDDLEVAFDKSGGQYGAELRAHLEAALPRVARDPGASRRSEVDIRLRLAEVAAAEGDPDAARAVASDLLRRDPTCAPAWRSLARIEERAERWEDSARAFEQLAALMRGPDLVPVALSLTRAAQAAGKPDLARSSLERALEQSPGDAALGAALRSVYQETGAFGELADLMLREAEAASSTEAKYGAMIEAARLLLYGTGDSSTGPAMAERALEVLTAARELNAEDLDGLLLQAEAFGGAGRGAEARAVLTHVIGAQRGKRTKELGQANYALYRVHTREGNLSDALDALQKAFECQPQNGGFALELGQLAIDLDEQDVAQRAFRAVTIMRSDPSNGITPQERAIAYYHLGNLAARQGDARRARLMLDKSLAEDPTLEAARALIESLQT